MEKVDPDLFRRLYTFSRMCATSFHLHIVESTSGEHTAVSHLAASYIPAFAISSRNLSKAPNKWSSFSMKLNPAAFVESCKHRAHQGVFCLRFDICPCSAD